MLEVRDWDHISLLFVAKARQGQGVGRQFVQLAIAACRQHKPGIGEITVSATPNAVPFYTRLGFRACAAEKLEIGMRFTPMALKV
jgi:GNAT superfamily N-acetyltransferase